jgi:caa(3)-type oxidase subunit IV
MAAIVDHPPAAHRRHPRYVRIWALLVGLLVLSVLGPTLGILWVTLLTAFGIAAVKALMVGAYFMHLDIERAYIRYLLLGLLAIVLVLFAGVAPDVMKKAGTNWRQTTTPAAPPPVAGH